MALFILAIAVKLGLHRSALAKNESAFKQLSTGMTKREVELVMGNPNKSSDTRQYYELANRGVFVTVIGNLEFQNDTLSRIWKDTID